MMLRNVKCDASSCASRKCEEVSDATCCEFESTLHMERNVGYRDKMMKGCEKTSTFMILPTASVYNAEYRKCLILSR